MAKKQEKWNKEKLLELLSKACKYYQSEYPLSEKPITRNFWRMKGFPATSTIDHIFGSWSNFVNNAIFHNDILEQIQNAKTELGEKLENEYTTSEKILLEELTKISGTKQRNQDVLNAYRKIVRETHRVQNATNTLTENLIECITKYQPYEVKIHPVNNESCAGIIHLTDAHFNEQISLPNNEFNWKIASARVKHLIDEATIHFKSKGITTVVLALTGDMLNSDRRLDELLLNSTNRSKALFLAFEILRQAIISLNQNFIVYVSSVTGNESRVGTDIGFSQPIASDNYDFSLFNLLYVYFYHSKNSDKGIIFNLDDDPSESVFNLLGHNVLLLHGHSIFGQSGSNAYSQKLQAIRAKYSDMGIQIRYTLFGHIHESLISDFFSRGGSLPGGNDYSFKGLHISGRASQNYHIIYDNGNINSVKVDLHTVNTENRYALDKSFEVYNSKSNTKLKGANQKTVFEVVI